jgi:four helix bundle protein
MRRCSAAVAANIAEACGRSHRQEAIQFLNIAMGSACELRYHLLLAGDLGYLGTHAQQTLLVDLDHGQRVLARYMHRLARPGTDSMHPSAFAVPAKRSMRRS